MFLIGEVSSDAKQKHEIIFPDTGVGIVLNLRYVPMQYAWFADISYEDFELKGIRITSSPNFLRQFRNLIPFGMACTVEENQEPLLQEDFSSQRARLYVLSGIEVDEVEDLINA